MKRFEVAILTALSSAAVFLLIGALFAGMGQIGVTDPHANYADAWRMYWGSAGLSTLVAVLMAVRS